MTRILVIDDEPQIRKFMRISLSANGYEVIEAETAADGIAAARAQAPDLLILDLGLPDLDGQEVISAVRESSEVPIIVLSVRAEELDKVEALDRGANDYVVKPFGIAELMARVRAVVRHRGVKEGADTVIETAGGVRIDLVRRVVSRGGEDLRLSKKEWELLDVFASNPDRLMTHRDLLLKVWGPAHVDDTAYLRVYVNQLRQKLETDPSQPSLIVNEPGIGYRLKV